jgi:protein-S-isoprenylcysteine O-methyltransferase Ste14
MMRAAEWEFRYRFWVYLALFTVAFGLYAVDPVNIVGWIVDAARPPAKNPFDLRLGVFQVVFAVAALVVAAGAWLRTWAAAYLDSTVVHDERLHADRVVADGPYRHLRNPLYLGLMIAAVGLATMASRLGALVILVAVPFFTLRLIGREETALAATGGASYSAFRAAVPRLLPALSPRLPASGARPRWGQAIAGELFFWALAAAVATFAATMKIEVYYWVLGAAFLLRFALARAWWRRRRDGASAS